MCQKKTKKKKKVSPASQNGGNEKKNGPITSACDGWTRVGHTFSPAIWNGGNGEKDKKKTKNESGSFWKKNFKGGQTWNFFCK